MQPGVHVCVCVSIQTMLERKSLTQLTVNLLGKKKRIKMVLDMQGQRTRGPHAKGGPAHTDETCRGVLQQGQRTGNPGLLDHID